MKTYRQLNTADCGPTCIRIICAYYKNKYSSKTLRSLCGLTTRLGITIYDLLSCLRRIGFQTSAVKLTLSDTEKMPLPAILYWKQEHFVVLHKITYNGDKKIFHIADPEFGKTKLDEEIFKKAFLGDSNTGISILMSPTNDFYRNKDKNKYTFKESLNVLNNVKKIILRYKWKFTFSALLTILAMLANWAIPIIFQKLIDNGIGHKNIDIVNMLAIGQFVLFCSYIISNNISNIVLSKIGYALGINLLSEYLHKLIKLPISFFDSKTNTDLIQMVDDQDNLKSFFIYDLIDFLFAVTNLLVFSVILINYNHVVFLIFSLFALISFLWTMFFIRKREHLNYARFSISSESKGGIYELIMGMKEIKINNAQNNKIKQIEEIQKKINKIQLKTLNINYLNTLGVLSLSKFKDILIIVFCAKYIISGHMTLGVLMSISYLLGQLNEPFNRIIIFSKTVQDAKMSLERLMEIQTEKNEDDKEVILDTYTSIKSIKLDNLSFKYPGSYSPYVLKDINISIPVGQVTAIVGASGSGKTTLLKLLLDFYNIEIGNIYIDSTKMTYINPEEWRSKCGIVMQDGKIFNGTLIDNIAIADEQPDLEKVYNSARVACINDFIKSLPKGYNTKIGNSGIELSGGQVQRILIARAVYKDPDFIFFDEATSCLDANNENYIMENLKEFYKNKTVIIVAHRLSTVKDADNIIVLDKGALVEQGSHEQLIDLRGYYFKLVKNQLELGV